MNILDSFFYWIVVLFGLGGVLWTAVGIPVGIIWITAFTLGKNKTSTFPTRNWLWVTVGGMGLLLIAFGIYTISSI
jgi:hypothetical protein